jgi:hypothetical protein
VRRTIILAIGLTACAPTQWSSRGYGDATITQGDKLNCSEQASVAATSAMGYSATAATKTWR